MFARLWKKIPLLAAVLGLAAGMAVTNVAAWAEESPDRVYKVGYVTDRRPVSFQNEDGELDGITRLVLDRVSQIAGVEFEYVALPSGSVTYDYLLGQGFDLVTSVEYNEENKKARGILISDPYLSSQKVVVAREGIDFTYNANLKVAVSTGSQTLKKVLASQYPNFELVDYPSMEACLDALKNGRADLMIQNQFVVEYWLFKPAYASLKVIPVMGMEDKLCFSAVVPLDNSDPARQQEMEELILRLDNAISEVSEEEMAMYIIEGTMENQYRFTAGDVLYRYRYAAAILLAAFLLIVLLAYQLIRARIRSLEARADARAKGRFLSAMSHEIRTPLNGLVGLNYLMSQNLDDRHKLADYLNQSITTARYLLSLVNDILDMSRLQDRDMKLENSHVNLRLLVSTAASVVKGGMSEKGIDFRMDVALPYPDITGDQVRIQQVLMNMLDNARKFTAEGGQVQLRTVQELEEEHKVRTTFLVTDNGCGMTEEFQEHIFESFSQELETVSKGNQGTGLGMAISYQLAQLMGGELKVNSQKGKGSEFVFTFPAELADEAGEEGWKEPEEAIKEPEQGDAGGQTPAEATEPGKDRNSRIRRASGMKVLVAEDNELNAEIILELLRDVGIEADLAENGREAVRKFAGSRVGEYSLILMDLLMPEMDGFAATKAIRSMKRPDAATVRIYACTANSFQEDRDRSLASGMDDFIMKPIDVESLLEKLK